MPTPKHPRRAARKAPEGPALRYLTVYMDEARFLALKRYAAEQRRTLLDLALEAFTLLADKHGIHGFKKGGRP